MRILIYSETDEAKAKQAELRGDGHHASLRNPHYFDPAQMDKTCDQIVADDQVILEAYIAAGIAVERLTTEKAVVEFESLPLADDTEKVSTPKRGRKRNGTDE
jgi:hypothetical protein